jgi:singapore isolate B (sub-type 7) whole genome shotgun sequence assembly, scaffold_4
MNELIDRYSGAMSIGADIANHFCEWMTDYNLPDSHILLRCFFPTVEQQRDFIHTYLEARYKREPTEEEVEKLRALVQKHEMLSHMHWFLWGLLQYQLSDIDWDYWGYANNRWNYYKEMKKLIFNADVLPLMPE